MTQHDAPCPADDVCPVCELDECRCDMPDCNTAGDPFHRHNPHCFGMDCPIRGEL